jgi:uncharacterized membrane protein YgaE (UPF0421/DUF939 family)
VWRRWARGPREVLVKYNTERQVPRHGRGEDTHPNTRSSFDLGALQLRLIARERVFSGVNRDFILDSLRTTLAAVAALLLARLLKMPESYWAPISTIVIIQSTIPPLTLGWQRFLGTALGALLAVGLATFFSASAWVYAVGIFLCGTVAWLLRVGGAYRFAGITLSIILLIPHTRPPWIVGLHRLLEVSLGIAVALVVTVG